MLQNMYSIYDSASEQWSPPFVAPKDAVAVRTFEKFLEGLSPYEINDFRMYHVGTFSVSDGSFSKLHAFAEVPCPSFQQSYREVKDAQ